MLFITLLFAFCLCLPPQCEAFPWLYQFPFQLTTHDADEVRSVVYRKKGTAHSGWMDGLTVRQEANSHTNTSTSFFSPSSSERQFADRRALNLDTAEKCYPTSAPGQTSKVCCIRLRAEQIRIWDSTPGRNKKYFSSLKLQEGLSSYLFRKSCVKWLGSPLTPTKCRE
jgi:hypothetical protein